MFTGISACSTSTRSSSGGESGGGESGGGSEGGGGSKRGSLDLVFPVNGVTSVATDITAIRIAAENIDTLTIDASNIDISPPLAGNVVTINDEEVQYQIAGSLNSNTIYTVEVFGLTSTSGDSVDTDSWSFTTASTTISYDCSSNTVHCVDDTAGINQEYSSIQVAVDITQPGDVVLVFDGDYDGFRFQKSGTSSQRITVVAAGQGSSITGSEPSGAAVRFQNASYITVDGFIVNRSGSPLVNDYDKACFAARGASSGSPMNSIHILNNHLTGCNPAGMYLSNVGNLNIIGNTIQLTNEVTGTSNTKGMGMYLANSGVDNAVIVENKILNNKGHGIHFNGDSSVGGDGLQTGHIIQRNFFVGNGRNAFNMDGVQNVLVENNVFNGQNKHGVRGFKIDGSDGPKDFTIVNNTFYNNESPVKFTNDEGGHVLYNNIVIDHDDNSFNITGGISFESNNLFSTSETATFTDAANEDFRLKSGSSAVNGGVASFQGKSAPSSDISSASRQGAPDNGAFEFGSSYPSWY